MANRFRPTPRFLSATGRIEDARATLREAVEANRALGDAANEAVALVNLAGLDLRLGDFESARAASAVAVAKAHELGHRQIAADAGVSLGYALLGLGRRAESRAAFIDALDQALGIGTTRSSRRALSGISLAANPGDLG